MDLKGSRTEKNLLAAFAGESQARNRYTFFASVAKKEGYEQIASLTAERVAFVGSASTTCVKTYATSAKPGMEDSRNTPFFPLRRSSSCPTTSPLRRGPSLSPLPFHIDRFFGQERIRELVSPFLAQGRSASSA